MFAEGESVGNAISDHPLNRVVHCEWRYVEARQEFEVQHDLKTLDNDRAQFDTSFAMTATLVCCSIVPRPVSSEKSYDAAHKSCGCSVRSDTRQCVCFDTKCVDAIDSSRSETSQHNHYSRHTALWIALVSMQSALVNVRSKREYAWPMLWKMEQYFAALIAIETRLYRFSLITSPNQCVVTFQTSTTSIAGNVSRGLLFSERLYNEENTPSKMVGFPNGSLWTLYQPWRQDYFFCCRPDCYWLDVCEKTHSWRTMFVKPCKYQHLQRGAITWRSFLRAIARQFSQS